MIASRSAYVEICYVYRELEAELQEVSPRKKVAPKSFDPRLGGTKGPRGPRRKIFWSIREDKASKISKVINSMVKCSIVILT